MPPRADVAVKRSAPLPCGIVSRESFLAVLIWILNQVEAGIVLVHGEYERFARRPEWLELS